MTTTIADVKITDDLLTVGLKDGRIISVPLAWYPKLLSASSATRCNFRFIGGGVGIHWQELDEDISLNGILAGISSNKQVA